MLETTLYPGTIINDETTSGGNWVNVANAGANDGSTAYVGLGSGNTESKDLKCTNFGAAIDAAATIDGVLLEYEIRLTIFTAHDYSIQLVISDSRAGNIKASNSFDTSTTIYSLGGAADTWGLSLTPAIVNSSTFGVALKIERDASSTIAHLDFVRLTIYYTLGGLPALMTYYKRLRS